MRLAVANHGLAKILQADSSNFDLVLEVVDEVFAVVPHASELMTGAYEVVVIVGHEKQAAIEALLHNPGKFFFLVGAGRKLLVGIAHRELVVFADALHIGVGQIDLAVFGDLYQRCRVIHDTLAAIGAGKVVVWKADGVTHLVSG